MEPQTSVALSIAGSDSSAGAGIQADLKTFSALQVYGATVITCVTAQNTTGVSAVHQIPAPIIEAQIDAVFADLSIGAIKTGMLGDETAIVAVVSKLRALAGNLPLVVDPVMVSTTGSRLLERGAEEALKRELLPIATLLTPNRHEAAVLLDCAPAGAGSEVERQARRLVALGPKSVLLKGGHAAGEEAVDVFFDGQSLLRFAAPRLHTKNTHGTGCTLSAAIAAFLVRGMPLEEAIGAAKTYLQSALEHADALRIGKGAGPLYHFWALEGRKKADG